MTTRSTFSRELEELNSSLEKMSIAAEEAIEQALKALISNDRETAQRLVKEDEAIDQMERDIETRCLNLDLRHISTALKVVTDLERIGDHAADIAELTLSINGEDSCDEIQHLPTMAENVKTMLRAAITAFINRDVAAAREIEKTDDVIDELFVKTRKEVVQLIASDISKSDKAIDFLMVAKYLERIGDHAVNVCEWTEFSVNGSVNDVRIL